MKPLRSRFRPVLVFLPFFLAPPGLPAAWWWQTPKATDAERARLERLETIQRPFRTDFATLSRDGRHLAYAVMESPYGRIDIVDLDRRSHRQSITLGDLRGSRLLALEWTSPERLVVALESGALVAVDLASDAPRLLLDPSLFDYDATDYAGANTIPDAAGVDLPAGEIEVEERRIPRWPRLLHVAPSEEDIVIVEGVAGDSRQNAFSETVRLDVRTGRWKRIDSVSIKPGTRILHDRQGRPRLIEDRSRLPLTWRVRLDPEKRWRAWQPLDRALAPELVEGFQSRRETLLDGRSAPLAFDVDPDVLYFASNLGRATFGIYALDLASGRPTGFALEDPALDLARPRGDFPAPASGRSERLLRAANAAAHYTDATMEPPATPLVFDRATSRLVGVRIEDAKHGDRWLDPTLATLQTEVAALFPGRRVRLLDWDDARERVLVRVEAEDDPGRYFIHERTTGRYTEYLRRAPWLSPERRHPTSAFAFTTESGRSVRGRLTFPRQPIVSPAPVVCLFSDDPWQEGDPGYDRTSQTIAELGCTVIEVEHAVASGARRAANPAMRSAPDRIVVEDVMAALAWLGRSHAINPKRVAAIGTGYGGWLALRAAQLRPDAFRCVVSLNGYDTVTRLFDRPRERELPDGIPRGLQFAYDMRDYMDAIKRELGPSSPDDGEGGGAGEGGDGQALDAEYSLGGTGTSRAIAARIQSRIEIEPVHLPAEMARWYFAPARSNANALSVSRHIAELRCPVFIVQDADNPQAPLGDAQRLRRRLAAARNPPEYWEVPALRWNRSLMERPEVWARIAAFFQETLYRYEVDIGELKEVSK